MRLRAAVVLACGLAVLLLPAARAAGARRPGPGSRGGEVHRMLLQALEELEPLQQEVDPMQSSSRVHPRLSLHAISARDDDDMYRALYLMSLQEFMNDGPTRGMYAYEPIAAIHAVPRNYNGFQPGRNGWCKHDDRDFATWHRPYMRLYELGLQRACWTVARRFVDQEMQRAGNRTCSMLRAPYWDLTRSTTPALLLRNSVSVYERDGSGLTSMSNPLRRYCYRSRVSGPRGSRSSGDCVVRSRNWPSTFRNNADTYAAELADFVDGPWSCTNTEQGNGCAGNLEDIHNGWHGSVGEDVTVLAWSSFDPLFWLFHMNVDRWLFLWQIQSEGNDYRGSLNYDPFPRSAACGGDIGACGFSYGSSRTGAFSRSAAGLSTASLADGPMLLLNGVDDTSGGDPAAPQARAYLAAHLDELPLTHETFKWSVVVNRLNTGALRDRTFALHVLLKPEGAPGVQVPRDQDGRVDETALASMTEYCGAHTGFKTMMPTMQLRNRTVSIQLTPCLRRNGLDADMPARDAANTTAGPARKPITRDQLQVVCVDARGADCTQQIRDQYDLALGWKVRTDRYDPLAQMFGRPAPTGALPLATGGSVSAEVLEAQGLSQPARRPGAKYLFVKQEAF